MHEASQSNGTTSEDALILLEKCREEVENINKKVASAVVQRDAASEDFSHKFLAIIQKIKDSMQELDLAYQMVKNESDVYEASNEATTEATSES
ncbi:hypothetical protein Pmani_021698 [Petrolisthes manimaculis]|uniref:Uncharacterized protein n=1 Tax=Petrolisthes manimaculis TaxID=1843537 RepID=A0AAE1U2V6_9EUCA|nr:hypothetical protein Pmani_021698 [Petrolisthes manimaculis]